MNWIAWKMLVGNRTKYLVMLFGITFASLLIAQQCSIFLGVLRMSAGQIRDVEDASIWVIDPRQRLVVQVSGGAPDAHKQRRLV